MVGRQEKSAQYFSDSLESPSTKAIVVFFKVYKIKNKITQTNAVYFPENIYLSDCQARARGDI